MPRMTVLQDEYITENGLGRIPGGTVVEVDEATAERWQMRGVARPPRAGDMTAREKKVAEAMRLLEEAGEDVSQYSHAITRETASHGERPRRPKRAAARPEVDGAENVSLIDTSEDEE